MASPEPSAAPAAQSRLLQLPGELRNRIYAHALEPCPVKLTPPSAVIYNPWIIRVSPGYTKHWSELRRKTLGLTQACRQLRAEFLPLHQEKMSVFIEDKYVEGYVTDFISDMKKPLGILNILVNGVDIDLMLLIRLKRAAPDLRIKFDCCWRHQFDFYGWPDSVLLEAFTNIESNGKWRQYIETSVTRLTWWRYKGLAIEVKPMAAEPWMPWTLLSSRNRAPDVSRWLPVQWRDRVGLTEELSFKVSKITVATVNHREKSLSGVKKKGRVGNVKGGKRWMN